jgi:hypothetical protein
VKQRLGNISRESDEPRPVLQISSRGHRGEMNWSQRRSARFLLIGLTLVVMATLHWAWLSSQGQETTFAVASLTGAVLVSAVGLVWVIRERSKA